MPPPRKPINESIVKQMVAEGHGVDAIGKATSVDGNTIRARLKEWGLEARLSWKTWTVEEDEFLLLNSHLFEDHEMARVLKRTTGSVMHRRNEALGVKKPVPYERRWTPAEERVISDNFSVRPIEEFLTLLPGRNKHQVWMKGDRMGLAFFDRPAREVIEVNRLVNRLKRKINERESKHH